MKGNNNNKYFYFGGKKYFLNLDKIKEVCFAPQNENSNNELEISQAYEMDDNGEMKLSSKVEHETKTFSNPQSDMIVYDFVKLLIISLLDYEGPEEIEDFGIILAINTLLYCGVLEIID